MSSYSLIPASYVYLRRENEVLLQLRQNTGYMDGHWAAAAAGHVEPGESVVDAAVREIVEELGIRVADGALVASSVMQRTDGSTNPIEQRVDWFFSCSIWVGEPTICEPEKCAELRWFDLAELPEALPAHERIALGWLRDHDEFGFLTYGFGS